MSYTTNYIGDILKEAYFITIKASGHLVNYHEVLYFTTEDELMAYIKEEFSATDGAKIVNYTIAQLMEGVSFEQSHRMGTGTTTTYVQVIHNTNLPSLYRFLDSIDIEDEDGEFILLSQYLKEAASTNDIEDVVFTFNESCENYW